MLVRIQSLLQQSIAEIAYAIAWKLGGRGRASRAAQRAIFERIHATNEWSDAESRSGPGSTVARGESIRPALASLVQRYGVHSILDAPCGDFNWMRNVTRDLDVTYTGVDVVPDLIAGNRQQYADERHRFECLDITHDPLPRADLILCRDALVHFSFADIEAALRNFRSSGARLLLATTFVDLKRNDDLRTGGWRPLNLQLEPFSLPEPLALIDDLPAGGAAPDKRLGLWALG